MTKVAEQSTSRFTLSASATAVGSMGQRDAVI